MEGEFSAAVAAAAAAAVAVSALSLVVKVGGEGWKEEIGCSSSCGQSEADGICAICLERIVLQETALVKGCEHAYCVTCILRWASYNKTPSCPQCKHPFDFLIIHRTLDGRIQDFMFEESVCLLLRASWFVPLTVESQEEAYEEQDFYQYDEYDADDDDIEEDYFVTRSSTLHIGNRRWGDNGYIRSGRKEARPVNRQHFGDLSGGSSSRKNKEVVKEVNRQHFSDLSGGSSSRKNEEVVKEVTGRRAKRALKRQAADKAAAAKHQQHLERLGRK